MLACLAVSLASFTGSYSSPVPPLSSCRLSSVVCRLSSVVGVDCRPCLRLFFSGCWCCPSTPSVAHYPPPCTSDLHRTPANDHCQSLLCVSEQSSVGDLCAAQSLPHSPAANHRYFCCCHWYCYWCCYCYCRHG
ncbi:hypothetical protein B0J11DRAFT_8905 [Dendryphion nanum]|uniref:Secreted protein n=1 Tax=Dendryphion nanum TaxID=256645 RepID=A0A9P9J105_9PLEO|nr:hypothetical protein B0J11DRAFT_8905 [Dendryphion nanum]